MKTMTRKLYRKSLLSLLGLSLLFCTELNAQSLEQAVAKALDSHPDIRQAFARFKAKEEEVNRAFSGYLPSVDIVAGYGYEYTDTPGNRRGALAGDDGETELMRGEFRLSLRQMLFDGMFTSSEVDRVKFEASAEQWTLIANAEDLALKVGQAYLGYLRAEQVLELSEKNIVVHQTLFDQIKERSDAGFDNDADLAQAEGRLARAFSNKIAAQNNLQDARAQFIRVANDQPENLVLPVPDADMLPKTKESGLALALKEHPVIKSAQQDIKAAQSFKDVVKASYYPTLSLELAANADNDIAGESGLNRFGPDVGGHRNDATAMIRLRYNLYSGGKDNASERNAAYKISEAQEINYSAHRQVTESYDLAWNANEMLALQKSFIRQHVTASKKAQVLYKAQFSGGTRTLLDLLDTENELFEARKDYLDAYFNELSAKYRLLNVTGQLLDSLRITRSEAWKGEHSYEQGAYHE